MSLETIIRECVSRGEFVHLSVSSNPSGKGFSCSYAPASAFGITILSGDDPVEIMCRAITDTKLRKRRTVEKPGASPEDNGEITI